MEKIRELRKKQRISQKELARQINVAQNTISRWESGERAVDSDALIKLSEFFGVPTDYLLGVDSSQVSINNEHFRFNEACTTRLKELRIKNAMSQKELADKLGYKQNTVSQWENGKRLMDTETIKILADFFEVSSDYLLGMSDLREESSSNKKEPINTDGLSDNKKALLTFAETVPEDKAAMILQVMKSIVEAD